MRPLSKKKNNTGVIIVLVLVVKPGKSAIFRNDWENRQFIAATQERVDMAGKSARWS
jgi:hypothetical protein